MAETSTGRTRFADTTLLRGTITPHKTLNLVRYLKCCSLLSANWRSKKRTVCAIAALKRSNASSRRRNSLRPKLISHLETAERTESSFLEQDKNLSAQELLSNDLENVDEFADYEANVKNNSELNFYGLDSEQEGIETETRQSGNKKGLWGALEKTALVLKQESEAWGPGADAVFLIYQDASGAITRVSVDENAILSRCGIDSSSSEEVPAFAFDIANERIAQAKMLARKIESGAFTPPRVGTVYKFVKECNGLVHNLRKEIVAAASAKHAGGLDLLKLSVAGFIVLYGCCFLWVAKKYLFSDTPLDGREFDEETRRILLRKAKARTQRQSLHHPSAARSLSEGRNGNLVKDDRGNSETKELEEQKRDLAINTSKGKLPMNVSQFDEKIIEIRAMAREARRLEHENSVDSTKIDHPVSNEVTKTKSDPKPAESSARKSSSQANGKAAHVLVTEKAEKLKLDARPSNLQTDYMVSSKDDNKFPFYLDASNDPIVGSSANHPHQPTVRLPDSDESKQTDLNAVNQTFIDVSGKDDNVASDSQTRSIPELALSNENATSGHNSKLANIQHENGYSTESTKDVEASNAVDLTGKISHCTPTMEPSKAKIRVITSVKEAKAFLAARRGKQVSNGFSATLSKPEQLDLSKQIESELQTTEEAKPPNFQTLDAADFKKFQPELPKLKLKEQQEAADEENLLCNKPTDGISEHDCSDDYDYSGDELEEDRKSSTKDDLDDSDWTTDDVLPLPKPEKVHLIKQVGSESQTTEAAEPCTFQTSEVADFKKFRPELPKLEFKEQEETADEENLSCSKPDFKEVTDGVSEHDSSDDYDYSDEEEGKSSNKDDVEVFDWTKDDVLREIVMKVNSNEEAGKSPFDGLTSKEEELFFEGIQRTIDQEGERVSKWVSERIENLDYGKDVIGSDDPAEVYVPRWKDPSKMKKSRVYEKSSEIRQKVLTEVMNQHASPFLKTENSLLKEDSVSSQKDPAVTAKENSLSANNIRSESHIVSSSHNQASVSGPKKNRVTRKNRTEMLQHKKKWTKGFKQLYEAETDPNRKALLNEIGQDLDRWMTDEELDEFRRLSAKLQDDDSKFFDEMEARMKYEREKFGREAMLHKYSEYKSEKTNLFWWMNLPYVLCIGLYRNKDGEVAKGFYCLEMASLLETNKKHFHVIAFQDRTDANNFCHLLETHLQSKGDGSAAVIPRHPKELYEEAKTEGYNVTVLKKAQVRMSINRPFEELEGIITDIGSAMYYDEILQDNVIDAGAVIDDAFGFNKYRTK
eukprot:TRINITY_DN8930_c0_g1_i1.p1 TRINITY_DN8930_c0_g1~~TRINITY_DN8930_c0_g1_i1.p1  ORF type:complete len:1272 (-),score=303.94 TRINITY_DN8930_c0_g1_i1:115-3930(-)